MKSWKIFIFVHRKELEHVKMKENYARLGTMVAKLDSV